MLHQVEDSSLRSSGSSASRSAASSGAISSRTSATRSSGISCTRLAWNSGSTSSRVSANCSRSRLSSRRLPSLAAQIADDLRQIGGVELVDFVAGYAQAHGAALRASNSTASHEMMPGGNCGRPSRPGCLLGHAASPRRRSEPRVADIDVGHDRRALTRDSSRSLTRTTRMPSVSIICLSSTSRASKISLSAGW